MKIASSSETLRKLYTNKYFPAPDMVAEVHWASKAETFHMKDDEKFLQKEEGVDIVPAWSLGLMISALPRIVSICESNDPLESVDYKLCIYSANLGEVSRVAYVNSDNELYYDTIEFELVDAVLRMIAIMDESGEYDEPQSI